MSNPIHPRHNLLDLYAPAGLEPRRAVWQSEPCPAWCAHPGHEDRDMVGDRVHQGPVQSVGLRLERAEEMVDGSFALDEARAYLELHAEASMPCVVVLRGDNAGWRMTLAEVETFAETLTALANEARSASTRVSA